MRTVLWHHAALSFRSLLLGQHGVLCSTWAHCAVINLGRRAGSPAHFRARATPTSPLTHSCCCTACASRWMTVWSWHTPSPLDQTARSLACSPSASPRAATSTASSLANTALLAPLHSLRVRPRCDCACVFVVWCAFVCFPRLSTVTFVILHADNKSTVLFQILSKRPLHLAVWIDGKSYQAPMVRLLSRGYGTRVWGLASSTPAVWGLACRATIICSMQSRCWLTSSATSDRCATVVAHA